MQWKHLFERKTLGMLNKELESESRLHRVLGPISLTSLGVGAIIGAGIFALTGRVAATDAGPSVVLSFAVAGLACVFAALCYAEFAAMVPVAGSAYTYTYATMGELFAWIIGWDLVLEYAMSCAVVASHWTHYLNEVLYNFFRIRLPAAITTDPFSAELGQRAYGNLPAVLIMMWVTYILVVGIRQSATTNTLLVIVKLFVVLFVIGLGAKYVTPANWTEIPYESRHSGDLSDYLSRHPELASKVEGLGVTEWTSGEMLATQHPEVLEGLPAEQVAEIRKLPHANKKWGLLALLGVKHLLDPIDASVRSNFMPYGFSGVMVGAALVFFAYVGFDSISTHAEEAVKPRRDVPIAILGALISCTLLYILVSAVITGMEPYPGIDTKAAVAAVFRKKAEVIESPLLSASAGIIAVGALAGMTSVLLVTFLSQARVFLAMARDGLLPQSIFAAIHEKYRTPYKSTILTGLVIALVAGYLPIKKLEEMVSIGTLMAFVMVCVSVMLLRIRHPEVHRPFRCPALWVVAPLGILVNISMMMFLPLDTWMRLVIWLALGIMIYLLYGVHQSRLRTVDPTLLAEELHPPTVP
ncbi:amino acid permease [Planctomicrobium sp. SH664]|uniref:amino acid permease n=1 Tax=Planctomicrobium sp. SH664 TaxID=3448125 RepID=UPI003F5B729F